MKTAIVVLSDPKAGGDLADGYRVLTF